MTDRWRRRAVALAGGCVLLLSACGGDDAATSPRPSTSTTAAPQPRATTSTTAAPRPPAAFTWAVHEVTAGELGSTWRAGCPVPVEELRRATVAHWAMDGGVHQGELVVAAAEVGRLEVVFAALFEARYPIERMEPISAFGGDDQASMTANNTSAFNCRTVAGTDRWSEHAFGRAIDVNPLLNPYVRSDGRVDPASGAPYADRTRTDPGLVHDGDPIVSAFATQGWEWGGHWSSGKDYQHFSTSGR